MPMVSQDVQDIFGGVSSLPAVHRRADQWAEQVNMLAYNGSRLGTRPGTFYIDTIASTTITDEDTVASFEIVRSAGERYTVVLSEGLLEVYDTLTGDPIDVIAPDGFGYLTGATDGFRWVTVGDRTVLVNCSRVTARGTATVPLASDTALVNVRQGNFGTTYTVSISTTVSNSTTVLTFSHTTPQSSATNAELNIATDVIAAALKTLMDANATFTARFTAVRTGSALAITSNGTSSSWTVTTSDGLGNEGMLVIQGSTQRFDDLPEQAPDGTVVEIRGDDSTGFDNYWVTYSTAKSSWTETAAPGSLAGFDASTMPHVLSYGGQYLAPTVHQGTANATLFTNLGLTLGVNTLVGHKIRNLSDGSEATVTSNTATTVTCTGLTGGGTNQFRLNDSVDVVGYGRLFTFAEAPWTDRPVGNTTTNPYPAFIGKPLRDVAVVQGRLELVADASVFLSRTADLFHCFRKTTTQVETDGPIDITETLPSSAKFHCGFDWDGKAFVWSDLGQYEIGGSPILSPQTVTFLRRTAYPNLGRIRPVVAGNRVFFVGVADGRTTVRELVRIGESDNYAVRDLTDDVSGYLKGVPKLLGADEEAGVLLLVTDDADHPNDPSDRVYVMSYRSDPDAGRLARWAWGEWTFPFIE